MHPCTAVCDMSGWRRSLLACLADTARCRACHLLTEAGMAPCKRLWGLGSGEHDCCCRPSTAAAQVARVLLPALLAIVQRPAESEAGVRRRALGIAHSLTVVLATLQACA